MGKQLPFNFMLFFCMVLCCLLIWLLKGGLLIALMVLPIFLIYFLALIFFIMLVMGLNALTFYLSDKLDKKEQKILPLLITPALLFMTGIIAEKDIRIVVLTVAGIVLVVNMISAIRYYRKNQAGNREEIM